MAAYFQIMQNINIGGRAGKSKFQYTLQSSDTATLYRVGPEMLEKIAKVPGLRDVTGDLYIKNPQMTLQIDREAAAVYGVTQDQIRQELYDCFGTRQVATIYTAINDYYVILECDPKVQANPSDWASCSSRRTSTDRPPPAVPRGGLRGERRDLADRAGRAISALIRMVPTIGALQVNHQGQQPAMTISFNGSRLCARRGGQCHPSDRTGGAPARLDRHGLPGRRAGFRGFAQGPGRAGAGRGVRRFRRARDSL